MKQLPVIKPSKGRYTHGVKAPHETNKVTSPTQAGYLNLRIKSSKAFPVSEMSTIEELINKVKKARDDRETATHDMAGQQLDLLERNYERLRNNKTTGNNKTGNDYLNIVQNNNGQHESIYADQKVAKTPLAKPHSYEFLKQQLRTIKKEVT